MTLEIDNDEPTSSSRLYVLPNFTTPEYASSASEKLCSNMFEDADAVRDYWRQIHGIELPKNLGGFVDVRFLPYSAMLVYPACCFASSYSFSSGDDPKRTKEKFTAIARKAFDMSPIAIAAEVAPATKKQRKA